MVGNHGDDRANGRQAAPAAVADTKAPQYRRHPTPSRLTSAEHGNPVAVWPLRPVSPTIFGRKAQLRSGQTMTQEAKATRRKARGSHNPVDRALWPGPKGR
jgi:hypothetical protein